MPQAINKDERAQRTGREIVPNETLSFSYRTASRRIRRKLGVIIAKTIRRMLHLYEKQK